MVAFHCGLAGHILCLYRMSEYVIRKSQKQTKEDAGKRIVRHAVFKLTLELRIENTQFLSGINMRFLLKQVSRKYCLEINCAGTIILSFALMEKKLRYAILNLWLS